MPQASNMFGASALIGGVLFLLWLVLVVVLGGIGDIAEGVFGVDIDAMGPTPHSRH